MDPLTILLVDDHPIVRAGCVKLLADAGMTTIHEAADGATALRLHGEVSPDVVILDLNLGRGDDGMMVMARMLATDPTTRVLVFSMNDDPVFAARALKAGARGYITKNDAPTTLVEAIGHVMAGDIHLSHAMARELALMTHSPPRDPLADLTPRERDILTRLGQGMTVGAIAEVLGISYKTVANTTTRLKDKLGAESTRALIKIAIERL